MTATFVPDDAGLDEILGNTRAYLHALASSVVDDAVQSGPRNPRHSTHIVDRIRVGQFRVQAGEAQQDIEWNDGRWHFIEFGSAHSSPARPVTRAAQNAGLIVQDRGPH